MKAAIATAEPPPATVCICLLANLFINLSNIFVNDKDEE
jgi:hypothetical protein